jgi:nucleoid DNA-binding protein
MGQKTTITKQKIVEHLHNNLGFAKRVIEKLISQMFDDIVEILKEDGSIQIPNFGTFSVNKKKARPGMNMHTKEKIIIDSREVVRFVPSRSLKKMVNDV